MWVRAPSARSTKIGIVGLDAGVAHNTLIVLNQLWRDALGQVGRNMIECSGPKVSDQLGDLEIRDRQSVGGEVPAVHVLRAAVVAG